MLDIVRIVFARLPSLPPSAARPDSDALHPLRNGPPAIPAGESLIEHSPAEPDIGQQQQSNGEPDAAPGGDGETKPLLDGAAEAKPAQTDAPPAATAAAPPSQLPRPDSTGWNAAGAPCMLRIVTEGASDKSRRYCKTRPAVHACFAICCVHGGDVPHGPP